MTPDCGEDEFEDAIIDLAMTLGWMVHTERPARIFADGEPKFVTAIKGHRGWPDLTAVHFDHGLIIAELKSATGRLTDDQRDWLTLLARYDHHGSPILVEVWRPADWPAIQTAFTHGIHTYRAHHRHNPVTPRATLPTSNQGGHMHHNDDRHDDHNDDIGDELADREHTPPSHQPPQPHQSDPQPPTTPATKRDRP